MKRRRHREGYHPARQRRGETSGAKVVAVGKGKIRDDGKLWKLGVKKGDRVLFGKFAGTEVALAGTEHLIIREDDVLGIMK